MNSKLYCPVLLIFFLLSLCSCGSSTSGGGGKNSDPVEIIVTDLQPAQSGKEYGYQFESSGGSGDYRYTASGLPNGLTLSSDGILTGTVNVDPASYSFTVRVEDKNYETNFDTKVFNIDVLLLAPDIYEPDNKFPSTVGKGGNDEAANIIIPGDDTQPHTIHQSGDTDYATIDLSDVDAGDQIMITAEYVTAKATLNVQLFNYQKQLVASVNNTDGQTKSTILYPCENPGIYFIKVDEFFGQVGDYDLTVQNTKNLIVIKPETLPQGYVGRAYNAQISATGGSGKYIYSAKGLPKNLFLDEKTGIISGDITGDKGTHMVEVTVTDEDFEKNETVTYELIVYDDLAINTETLPDAKRNANYTFTINVSGGSGDYSFRCINLPQILMVNAESGLIYGNSTGLVGTYDFICEVTDNTTGVSVEKNLQIKIVEYLPDEYEADNNNDINTTTTIIKPGEAQNHNFNVSGDIDYIKIDLSDIVAGDVIVIKTSMFEAETDTNLTLYGKSQALITSNNNANGTVYSEIVFVCDDPGVYYVAVSESKKLWGDYTISVKNSGQKLKIITTEIPDKLKTIAVNEKVNVVNGSGAFTYTLENQPANLTINQEGIISGTIGVDVGSYMFIVRVRDNVYDGMMDEVVLTLNVVDYYPDLFEPDNSAQEAKPITPGQEQEHNFNNISDIDYYQVDLTNVAAGNVVLIETSFLTKQTDTNISLYTNELSLITSDNDSGVDNYSLIAYECLNPGKYLLMVEESQNKTGDYKIKITDTGAKIQITTNILKDALKNAPYEEQIVVTGGSGNYHYIANNLPGNLTISQTGLISGNITAIPGQYTITVRVEDLSYPGVFNQKGFNINIVHFLPDASEPNADFNTAKIIKPGDSIPNTFNITGDLDNFKLDLMDVPVGNIIKIETSFLSETTDTVMALFTNDGSLIISDNNGGNDVYSKIIYTCDVSGFFFVQMGEMHSGLGDYNLIVTDCGPAVDLITASLPDALQNANYTTQVVAQGGSGSYTFSATGLPSGISMASNGTISGAVSALSGSFSVAITATDVANNENNRTKNITLKVVDFYPDEFEPDNGFASAKNSNLDQEYYHNFNDASDIDYMMVNLTGITSGDVIIFETLPSSKPTDTTLTLFDSNQAVLEFDDNDGDIAGYSKIVRSLAPGNYYVKIENAKTKANTGDFIFIITNAGQKINISANAFPFAESDILYNQVISATGGGTKRFTLESGSLPGGLSIVETTGQITGTNYESGTFNFVVRAYDANFPENYNTKSFSMDAYIGRKIVATDVYKKMVWSTEVINIDSCGSLYCIEHHYPRTVSGTFNGGIIKSQFQDMIIEEYSIPTELDTWKNTTNYQLNLTTGVLSATFLTDEYTKKTGVFGVKTTIAANDIDLIQSSSPDITFKTYDLVYKAYDPNHPENYAIFTYTIDMTPQ